MISPPVLRKLIREKTYQDRQIVVITNKPGRPGKKYRPANNSDLLTFQSATEYMKTKLKQLDMNGISPVPHEIIDTPNNKEYVVGGPYWRHTNVVLYGMTQWRHLFNTRQTLTMVVFVEKIKAAHNLMLSKGYDPAYAKAITTYLGIMLDRLADKCATLCIYDTSGEKIEHVFGRQALPMVWHYVEINPFTDMGWNNMQNWVFRVIDHCSRIETPATRIAQESATSLSYEDEYFDAVFTDPPYYDNVHFSLLSDFFYVWLKRTVGDLYPELFSTPLTPKSNEVIASSPMTRMDQKNANRDGVKTKQDYETLLSKSFHEINRILKNHGIVIIVYSHKSTEGWETLINSILDSGLVITAAWPIHTEMKSRMAAKGSAALNSSIYMVARKSKKEKHGFYRTVKRTMEKYVTVKLARLWDQGIAGGDFFISAIGASIEIFGKYDKITDDNDKPITTKRLLDDVRKIVTDFAISQVLQGGFGGEISQLTRFYVLWRWSYGSAKIPFDDAFKLAHSVGVDIEREYNKSFIKKESGFIRVLSPTERKMKDIGSRELVDVLHKSVLLWKDNKKDDMLEELKQSGFMGSDVFYKVAQAISESNPKSQESRLLDGFLSGRAMILDNAVVEDSSQTKLVS